MYGFDSFFYRCFQVSVRVGELSLTGIVFKQPVFRES